MPRTFNATYSLWGNLYRGRFYVEGKRVAEYKFDACLNAFMKSGASYTRTHKVLTSWKYTTIWKEA